jgi:hypothetical protein
MELDDTTAINDLSHPDPERRAAAGTHLEVAINGGDQPTVEGLALDLLAALEHAVTRADRRIALLNAYGQARLGDDWWPSNASAWIGDADGDELAELLG